jgi:hypothetical protein
MCRLLALGGALVFALLLLERQAEERGGLAVFSE